MGMFDEVVCEMELPNTPPDFIGPGHKFQTKDTGCTMQTHTIGRDGAFSLGDFTGDLRFYTSNIVGGGPGIYTKDGEDAEAVEYVARIVGGKVMSIDEVERSVEPAMRSGIHNVRVYIIPTEEDKAFRRAREEETLIGRRLYVLYGGQDDGYWVEVVADGARQLCWRKDDGELEIEYRESRDRLFFDTEEAAKARRDERLNKWNAQKREYEEYAAKWRADRMAR